MKKIFNKRKKHMKCLTHYTKVLKFIKQNKNKTYLQLPPIKGKM